MEFTYCYAQDTEIINDIEDVNIEDNILQLGICINRLSPINAEPGNKILFGVILLLRQLR